MTLEACGGGSNHQSYERLQLDNGASYRNVVNTKHVHTISLNLVLSKKLTQDDPLTPKNGLIWFTIKSTISIDQRDS